MQAYSESNILKYFPKGNIPRPKQIEILGKVDDALKANKKFIIIQAPTGSGKSHIAATIAAATPPPEQGFIDLIDKHDMMARADDDSYLHEEYVKGLPSFNSYILTTTKSLQNQYEELFPNDCITLKGKKNYQCNVDPDFDCELAPCVMDSTQLLKCITTNNCPYFNKFDAALINNFSVLSYSKFFQMPDFLKKRAIIICDEASELEDEIVSQFSATIEYNKLAKEGIKISPLLVDDHDKVRGWLTDLVFQLKQNKKVLLEKIFKAKKKRAVQIVNTIKLKYISRLLDSLVLVLVNFDAAEFLIERDADKASFTPLYINKLSEHIFKYADHIILLSATIIDPKTFSKVLGIKDYEYIDAGSVFDPKKSPIYCPGKYNLSYQNIAKNLPKVVEQAIKICDFYKGKSGIVHTHTHKIANAIQKKVGLDYRFLFREAGITNERIMEEHSFRQDGTVLVSPSLGYGTNLVDELGRFQIVVKLPYLPLQSKRIKILSERDYNWYNMKMLTSLVQMCGRCTRSVDDYSDTYILDGSTFNILKKNWSLLPRDFQLRLK